MANPKDTKKEAKAAQKVFDKASFAKLYSSFVTPEHSSEVQYLSTGSFILDRLLGGGLPLGKFVQFYSEEGVGKTLVALHICRALIEHTKASVLYVDAERALTNELLHGCLLDQFGKRFGVLKTRVFEDLDEQLMPFVCGDDNLRLIVIDSLRNMTCREIVNNKIGQARPGCRALIRGEFLERYHENCGRRGVAMFYVNQMRMRLNFRMPHLTRLDDASDNATKFIMDVRIRAQLRKAIVNANKEKIGGQIQLTCVKNKVGRMGNAKATLVAQYGVGINNLATYASLLEELGYLIVQRADNQTLALPGVNDGQPVVLKSSIEVQQFIKDHLEFVSPLLVQNSEKVAPSISVFEGEAQSGDTELEEDEG